MFIERDFGSRIDRKAHNRIQKPEGSCTRCDQPAELGRKMCRVHLDAGNAQVKAWRARQKKMPAPKGTRDMLIWVKREFGDFGSRR